MASSTRTNTLKVLQSADEDDRLRKFCSALGLQRGPFVRKVIDSAIRAHRSEDLRDMEWPRHGHIALCPGRPRFGGAPTPLRL